ncbi:MAG: tryptophan-rich sensory protein [Candidatus Uhrbacteria bacterium]|nr:tryptophan-rich sensory protein [Candidatus Uhrbacteria bacterium]
MMRVLFVCEGNIGCSQMAEAYLRAYGRNYDVSSAGTRVGDKNGDRLGDVEMAEYCVACLEEDGIDIKDYKRSSLEKAWVDWADRVIVMASPKTCPTFLFRHNNVRFWSVESPYLLSRESTRETADILKSDIKHMILKDTELNNIASRPARNPWAYLFVIPIITFLVASLGSLITSNGLTWYYKLNIPELAFSGATTGIVWTSIYILATLAAIIAWRQMPRDNRFIATFIVFVANILLNVFWSFLFFRMHLISASVIESGILAVSVLLLILLMWKNARAASILLLPYLVWVMFATYLAFQVLVLNRFLP